MESGRVSAFLTAVGTWAAGQRGIAGVALAGSYARGCAREGSDVDLVILTGDPAVYLQDDDWTHTFGAVIRSQIEDYGRLTSLRVWYNDGLEVEYGFADPEWASTPLDEGTQQVVAGGLQILYERDRLLTKLLAQRSGVGAAVPVIPGQSSLTHILFDFFGTLVRYSDSRVNQGFGRSWDVVVEAGASLDYPRFLTAWDGTCEEFERRARHSLSEYSMDSVCDAFLRHVLSAPPTTALTARFRDTYLSEWNSGVHYIPGVTPLLVDLSARFTLVLVTNTNETDLIDGHLTAMGIKPCFSAVVTSIEHGRRKPSRSIFDEALERSKGTAAQAVYVGDSYAADYLGAMDAGIRALLIDPEHRFDVPAASRIRSVLDLRSMLDEQSGIAWRGQA